MPTSRRLLDASQSKIKQTVSSAETLQVGSPTSLLTGVWGGRLTVQGLPTCFS